MFYKFRQNNTSGFFEEKPPLSSSVFIESDSENDAIERAQKIGLYWDGAKNKVDCECCGDRWKAEPEVANPIIDEENILPTVESIAQYEADEFGCTTSMIFKSDDVRIFIPDEETCKYTTLEICANSDKDATEIEEVPDSQKPKFNVPEGHVLVKDLKEGEGGELVTSEASLNGQAIFKRDGEIFVFHNTDFRKVPAASFRYWEDVCVSIDS